MSLNLFNCESPLSSNSPDYNQSHSRGLLDPANRDPFGMKLGKFSGASDGGVAFVDPTVTNYQSLIDGIEPGTQVVVLDPNQDGVQQMTDALVENKFSAVHIISHGSYGNIQLGSSALGYDSLTKNIGVLGQWKDYLTSDADILLYGCNVAAGTQGEAFVQQLSQITGADVAASDDLSGSAALGGDWKLEATTGEVETASVLQPKAMEAYSNVLGNFNAGNFTELQAVINNANSQSGDDIITLTNNIQLTGLLPAINSNITFNGNGLVVSGDANNNGANDAGDVQIFSINSGTVSFSNLTLANGRAVGGNGNNGGGGGAGMGGALFINGGTVTANGVIFTNNQAIGGSGGNGFSSAAGGSGGSYSSFYRSYGFPRNGGYYEYVGYSGYAGIDGGAGGAGGIALRSYIRTL